MSENQMEEIKLEEKLEDITGINCIYVPVSDVYESVQWYQKNLGYEPTNHVPVKPGMGHAIMRKPKIAAIFLIESQAEGGRLGFTGNGGDRVPVLCFITPCIQEMYNRFKENGVNIASDIPEGRACGPNFQFFDPDGNKWEIWQP